MNFETWLAANGYDAAQLSAPQKAHLELAFKAETSTKEKPIDDMLSKHVTNAKRIESINKMVERAARPYATAGNHEMIEKLDQLRQLATADESVSAMDFENKLHKFDKGLPPMAFAQSSSKEVSQDVLEAALCKTLSLSGVEKQYSDQVLSTADKKFNHGLGLQEFLLLAAQQHGYRGSHRDLRAMCIAAFKPPYTNGYDGQLAVGPSTINVTGILSNVANKFVREAFNFVETDWRSISAIRSVSDFKSIAGYSLSGDLSYDLIPAGGQIKHGTLGETEYSNQAKSYGKLLGIDRQAMINDDLGAFAAVNRKLGRGGALKINSVFWTEFLDNSSFFTSGLGNYDDGAADTSMDLTGIANANTLFELLTDPDGSPMGTTPAIVLVPPQLWPSAFTLLNSPQLNLATSTSASTGTNSPWAGMFKLVKSRYLAMSSISGYSAKAWYLLADPNDVPVIETCFLNGVEFPTVETGEMDFDRLGMAVRAYHDFGVAKQEYRGGIKLKGEN